MVSPRPFGGRRAPARAIRPVRGTRTPAWRHAALVAFASLLLGSTPAFAQLDDTSWGITAGFSPQWSIPSNLFADLFDATRLDVNGPEFRVGVVRGTTLGGEWGLSLVHKRLSKESTLQLEGTDDVLTVVAEDAELIGVEVHRFFPFTTRGNIQIGANLGGGIAQLRGFVTGTYTGTTSTDFTIPFPEAFTVTDRDIDWLPLGRAELGLAVLVGERLKVRVSGGFNMPGYQIVSFSFSYLLGQDR